MDTHANTRTVDTHANTRTVDTHANTRTVDTHTNTLSLLHRHTHTEVRTHAHTQRRTHTYNLTVTAFCVTVERKCAPERRGEIGNLGLLCIVALWGGGGGVLTLVLV